MFTIFDIERSFDERVFRNFQDVRDFIVGADLGRTKFIVVEFDTAQGWCRDITDLFIEPEQEDRPEYPATFNRTAYLRQSGMFGR
ncbi:MAG: hypothetical protein E5X05_01455 [Mesorhizobium sp.]|nr:MAG: hypothetical protein E5X05_01455 [Mesorhizobium sp.]